MKKIIIVAPVSKSLIDFRGDLIKDMKNKGYNVITVSPALTEDYAKYFKISSSVVSVDGVRIFLTLSKL